jgi:hypothetical protein
MTSGQNHRVSRADPSRVPTDIVSPWEEVRALPRR